MHKPSANSAASSATAAPSANSVFRWQLLLALLVCAMLTGLAASMLMAAREVTGVADADYYRHGLHYGRTRTGSNNPGLWWQMQTTMAGGLLQVKVTDRSGAPVGGGVLKFESEQPYTAAAPEFEESAQGTFHGRRPLSRQGELRGTLRYSRGEAFATRKVVLLN